ncbi:hypothetical protein [Paenibacillus sp. 453mf]|uniref:hypothetical protein n=1 Tax=Paenibacillus sp. 453mf TaxID=1761874 RepID=UPI0008E7AE5A|nr:hypothetical protein [Paenibacillus sp. 453mf]SFS76293.1 hypothetical protein SAMN04488601_10354 [Paenibacillus sp. 453mf]
MKMEITLAKLKEMELMSRGNPEKTVAYKLKQKRYDDMVSSLFTAEAPIMYLPSKSEEYVQRAEQIAAESGDPDDLARAVILRDGFEYYEADNMKHLDWKETRSQLKVKLASGERLSQRDVLAAERLARANSSVNNIALYSQVKTGYENPTECVTEEPAPQRKVTADDVEKAREEAQRNPHPRNMVKFSQVRREFMAEGGE